MKETVEQFGPFHIEFDPVTLVLNFGPDIVKIHVQNEITSSSGSNVIVPTDRHTDRHD